MNLDAATGGDQQGLDAFALTWAKVLTHATYVPMTWPNMLIFLRRMSERLAEALTAETFDPLAGYRIGTELVDRDFAAAEALGGTLRTLHTGLLEHLGLAGDAEAQRRLVGLAEGIATAHCRALRDRALDGQETVRAAAVTARDRAERKLRETEAELRHAALHDALTGLPNRGWLTNELERVLAAPVEGRLAVCVIGLGAFDRINDSLGPSVADRLLCAVADRLRGLAQETGFLLARLDGDSFALLAERTTGAEDAVKIADTVLRLLDEPFLVGSYELPVHACAGVVERATSSCAATELMRAAGVSLRWAKADRGPRWALFDEERNADQIAVHRLSAAMPAALSRREFTLAYQPLVDLASGRLVGFEALARWSHPVLGPVSPERFIPLAEDTGLIIPLGLQLLEQACRDGAAWPGPADRSPYLSVNLAARQIRHVGLTGEVAAILDRSGLPPARLQLEITEGTAFDTGADTLATLDDLTRLGIRLAIDDFGTGYANHAVLPDLPIHTLKLPVAVTQSVGRSPRNPKGEAVLHNLIALGHSLDLTVTAEGVETADQARRLRSLHCDTGQGWHFGRPMSAQAAAELLLAA